MSQAGSLKTVSSGGGITEITTDSGNAFPIAGIVDIIGGPGITTSAVGNVITITDTDTSLTFATDSGSATPSADTITFHGTNGLLFSGSGSTVTGNLASIPNSALTNSSITVTGSGITVGGSPVSLGGTLTLTATTPSTVATSLTPDEGGAVPAVANTIPAIGIKDGSTAQVTMTHNQAGNFTIEDRAFCTAYVVDPSSTIGARGTFTTIGAAITAAVADGQPRDIFIRPGTYTENLTLSSGINLTAFSCDPGQYATGSVIIIGTLTMTTAGTVTVSGIVLQTNSAAVLSVTGSAASIVNMENCYLNLTNNSGITFSTSSGSAQVNLLYSSGDLGTTGINIFAHSSAGVLRLIGTQFTNSGSSLLANTQSSGNLGLQWSYIRNPLTVSSTGLLGMNNSAIDTGGIARTALTYGGNVSGLCNFCYFSSDTATAISISTQLSLNSCSVTCSNAAAIAGAGTIQYGMLNFGSSSGAITTATQTPRYHSNDATVIKSPSAYPYTTLPQDGLILVDTSSARTIVPLASPTTGQTHRIKDNVGSGAANNTTITPSGKNIDGSASFVMNTNYGSVDIIYNGSEWSVV